MAPLRLLIQLLLFTPLTTSLHLPLRLTFSQPPFSTTNNPSNTTSHNLLTLPPPSAANVPTAHCVTSPYWLLPHFNPQDCQDALTTMRVAEVDLHGAEQFEFVTPGADPYHTLRVMQTPRRYANGTCVVAIVMLASLSPGEVPDVAPARRPETDVTSFESLWGIARQVDEGCVAGNDAAAGWAVDGGRNSIGVFHWSARSPIDMKHFPFPGGPGLDGESTA